MTILDDLKHQWQYGQHTIRLIIVLSICFAGLLILKIVTHLPGIGLAMQDIVQWLSVSGDFSKVITRPWTLLTYAFIHLDVWHWLNNIIFLYIFGRILEEFIGSKYIYPMFLSGALAGSLVFVLCAQIWPSYFGGATMMGASAGIFAILFAAVQVAPDYSVSIIFLGPVRIKYIALVLLLLDLAFIADDVNTGGHISHLAGAAMGWFPIRMVYRGYDISNLAEKIKAPFTKEKKVVPKAKHLKVVHKPSPSVTDNRVIDKMAKDRKSDIERIDRILDKMNEKGGIDKLTPEEKEILFRAPKDLE